MIAVEFFLTACPPMTWLYNHYITLTYVIERRVVPAEHQTILSPFTTDVQVDG
jgi:hypothetical protein